MNEEWLLYQIRKAKLQNELKANPFISNRRDPSDFKCILTPRDEEELRHKTLTENRDKRHKEMMASIHAQKDKEMEERRQRYINTGKYD